jgi:hypothetical protein
MADQTILNPLWPFGLDAVKWGFLCAAAQQANHKNEENARLYPQVVKDWDANHIQNPSVYPLSTRPKVPQKVVVALAPVESWGLWPTAVVSNEPVCDEIPFVDINAPKPQRPLTISIGPPNPRVPNEYVALPDDNAEDGYSFMGLKDGKPCTWTKKIFKTPFGDVGVWKLE